MQAEGSTSTLVTVVAAQDLQPGDVLRRYEAETAQYDPREGNVPLSDVIDTQAPSGSTDEAANDERPTAKVLEE